MSDTDENVFVVKSCHALNNDVPMAASEYTGTLGGFGFPTVLKAQHRCLKQIINSIPFQDQEQVRTRDLFMLALAEMDKTSPEDIESLCERIATHAATTDLLEKRISTMTPADYIVDKNHATPDAVSFAEVRNKILEPENKRFAEVLPKPGGATNEWANLDLDEAGEPTPGW